MPISSCRCGLPSANASWEVAPTQVVQLDCRNWYAAVCQTVRALGGRHGAGQGHGQCWGTKAVGHTLGPEPLGVYIFHSTCINGTLMCPHLECPVLGPWSAWSECSAVCGGGTMVRHRSCEEHPEGVPCQALDLQQWQECNPQACPGECPGSGLYSPVDRMLCTGGVKFTLRLFTCSFLCPRILFLSRHSLVMLIPRISCL